MNNEKINKLSRKYNMIKLAQSTAQITFDAGIVFTIIIIVVNTLRIKQNTIDSMGYVNHLFTGISLSMLFFSGILKIYLKRKKADIMETFLELNYSEVDELVNINKKLKNWFMINHSVYRQYHTSEAAVFEMQGSNSARKILITIVRYFAFIICGVFIICISNVSSKQNSSKTTDNTDKESAETLKEDTANYDMTDDDKYECYVALNNDIIQCYEYTIKLYIKSNGSEETINNTMYNGNIDMAPVRVYSYDHLEKAKSAAAKLPHTSLDEKTQNVLGPVEKVYTIANQIYAAYGHDINQYIPIEKTDKSKEELHKEFLIAVNELQTAYGDFYLELEHACQEYQMKDLENYKKSGNRDMYEILNILIATKEIDCYFEDNNITTENMFDMNLEEYEKALDKYNKAYDEFKNENLSNEIWQIGFYLDDVESTHTLVNNIKLKVEQRDYNAGEDTSRHGVKVAGGVDDYIGDVRDNYNSMIDTYNNMLDYDKENSK